MYGQQNLKFDVKILSILFDLRNGKEGGGHCVLLRQIICISHSMRTRIAQSVQRLYMVWVVRGSSTTAGETVQTGPGKNAASFSGLDLPGRGVHHQRYLALRLRTIRAVPQLCVRGTFWGKINFFLSFVICLIVKRMIKLGVKGLAGYKTRTRKIM